ncbi:MAG TPA: hypothetical protein VK808_00330, partial [Bacteroidia bacterium]|nr:hypothetical protein [Bacteroidia bacterium]
MNKRLLSAICFLSIAISGPVRAQEWVKLMHDKNANVHDVQKAFYEWYGSDKYTRVIPDHETGYELFKRWENIMVPRTYPSGNRNNMAKLTNDYITYKKQEGKNALHETRPSQSADWTYAGTDKVLVNGGGDGRINRIRFYPGNSTILYACAPGGGLWKSTNGGTSWATNTDQLVEISTSDVAIDPVNPSIMYLATGDGDGYDAFTSGILKSTDTGKTWNTTGLNFQLATSGYYSYEGNQLLINPDSTNVVFAAMNIGLYRTRDSGVTWTNVLNDDIRSIEFEPYHSNVVYASSEYGSFYRSTDGGFTFTKIVAGLPTSDVARLSIGVSPADSNRVYILADENANSRFYGLYMSVNRGQTFTTQSSFAGGAPNVLGWSPSGNDSSGQGWYTLSLAVSPTNADTIVVGGVNIWYSGNKG